MPHAVGPRLAAMMFLHYFVMGAWLVTLPTYLLAPPGVGLNFTPSQVSWIFSTLAIGGFVAPLFVGLLADRFFSSERVMAVLATAMALLLGAAGWWCESRAQPIEAAFRDAGQAETVDGRPFLDAWDEYVSLEERDPQGERTRTLRKQLAGPRERIASSASLQNDVHETYRVLFLIMLAYCTCMMMNSTLANVMGMRNLADPPRHFGLVRLWGTVGWLIAGFAVGPLMRPPSHLPLYLGAVFGLVHGIYSLTLPHTPPKGRSSPIREVIGLPAIALFRQFSFVVFVVSLFIAAVMQQWYGVYAPPFLYDVGVRPAASWMTIAQVIEVCCLMLIPFMRERLGLKGVMMIGLIAWVGRNAAFTWGEWWVIVCVGLPLHGASYTFFTIVGSLYIDRLAPPHLRAGAQGLLTLVSLGPGIMLGNWLSGQAVEHYTTATVVDWSSVWFVPLIGNLVAAALFAILFHAPDSHGPGEHSTVVEPPFEYVPEPKSPV